jgi:hypothetical protein
VIKNVIKLILLIALIAGISGCAEIIKKFTPKKKAEKADYSFYQIEDYKPRPAPERYVKNHTLWHNWHRELERVDETNCTRDLFNAKESLKYLLAMRDLLMEEQAKKLDVQINDMKEVIDYIEKRKECIKDNVHNMHTIERIDRVVEGEFCYKHMQKYIK